MKISETNPQTPQAEALRTAAEAFGGKSEQELMSALKSAAAERRSAGMLTDEQMDDVFGAIAPMLNDQQLKKMESIFRQLRESIK